MIRRLIAFVFASALLVAGLYLLYLELFVARIIKFHFHGGRRLHRSRRRRVALGGFH
jgi:hypothetical protein